MDSKPHGTNGRIALVGLNMGGPKDLDGVGPFLEELFADKALVRLPWFLRIAQGRFARRISARRTPEVRENYRKIGGGSPIVKFTQAQVEGAADRLRDLGLDVLPLVAMRYSAPRAKEAARAIKDAGITEVVALSLYPQYSPATGGSSLGDFKAALATERIAGLKVHEVDRFPVEEFYLEAMAVMVREALARMAEPAPHLLFSAHGLPVSYVRNGDPYQRELLATYEGVVARLPKGLAHSISYQSRVGTQEWLRPYTDEHLRELAKAGVRRLLMLPCGFVSDHVETLYEMDMLYGDLARTLGIAEVVRIPALNDHPLFVKGLGEFIFRRIRSGKAAGAMTGASR